ncbi:testis-expressed protein 26-like [Carcharodon carcharias]|uniref:testis-expressed protein 26-like n=1 Tax=Carcharodon carcharias TaxID=13397 RepID=UPI001B7EAAF3|nr:testis-expressed protein 26-like [Carcharodon carcharias]
MATAEHKAKRPHLPRPSRCCCEVKNDHRKAKKNKEPAIPQKVTKVKESKKYGKRKADLKTSAPNFCPGTSPAFDPYQTTSKREFIYRPGSVPERIRPGSSNGYTFPFQLHEPIGDTSYTNDYPWIDCSNQQPMRSGTSPGCRGNAIQQCKCWLLWKLLMKDPEAYHRVKACFLKSMSSEDMGKVRACQFDTIYRQDYLGIQQESMKCPPCLPNIYRPDQPSCSLTNNQYHDRKRIQKPDLAVCTSRYGSNKRGDITAKGIVPSVTQAHIRNQENKKQLTTYDREYGNFNMEFAKILKSLEPKAIQSYLSSLSIKDQEVVLQFLDNMASGSETN